MGLERSYTRFGLSPLRKANPELEEESNDTTSLLAVSDSDSTNKLRKRGWASQDSSRDSSRESSRDYEAPKMRRLSRDKDGEEARTGFKALQIPQSIRHRVGAVGNVRMKNSSPWESLTLHFSLMLNDSVMIASRKDRRFVGVREFSCSGADADRKVKMLQRIRHENFIAFLDECFSFEGSYYFVFEHEITCREPGITSCEKFPITLAQYALVTPYPTEQQLATILGQILDGLKYLASMGLEHGAVTCKNVLIGTQGSIRIAGQECCRELVSNRGSIRDIKGVGCVTTELMHKEPKCEGPIKVRDVRRWPLDSKAVQFLLMTESAYSIDELMKHPLFSYERQKIDLKPNVYTAEFSVFRGHNIAP